MTSCAYQFDPLQWICCLFHPFQPVAVPEQQLHSLVVVLLRRVQQGRTVHLGTVDHVAHRLQVNLKQFGAGIEIGHFFFSVYCCFAFAVGQFFSFGVPAPLEDVLHDGAVLVDGGAVDSVFNQLGGIGQRLDLFIIEAVDEEARIENRTSFNPIPVL